MAIRPFRFRCFHSSTFLRQKFQGRRAIDRSNHTILFPFPSILSFLDFECDVSEAIYLSSEFLERCTTAALSSFFLVSAFNREQPFRKLHSIRISHRGRSCRLHSVLILRLHFILIDASSPTRAATQIRCTRATDCCSIISFALEETYFYDPFKTFAAQTHALKTNWRDGRKTA